jgi:hypothetical protein
MTNLTFQELNDANVARCEGSFHHTVDGWSIQDWSIAVFGEAGAFLGLVTADQEMKKAISKIDDLKQQFVGMNKKISNLKKLYDDKLATADETTPKNEIESVLQQYEAVLQEFMAVPWVTQSDREKMRKENESGEPPDVNGSIFDARHQLAQGELEGAVDALSDTASILETILGDREEEWSPRSRNQETYLYQNGSIDDPS